jgi:type VI protein secretion system component VasK
MNIRESNVPEVPERLGVLENRMERVEEGVANFRAFQVEARSFFTRADTRAEAEKARYVRRDQEAAAHEAKLNRRLGLGTLIVLVLTLVLGVLVYFEGRRQAREALTVPADTTQLTPDPVKRSPHAVVSH